MKKQLLAYLFTALFAQITFADCIQKFQENLSLKNDGLIKMQEDMKDIFGYDTPWWTNTDLIEFSSTIIYPVGVPAMLGVSSSINGGEFSTDATQNAQLKAMHKENLNFARKLILEAKMKSGKNLQSFVQNLRDEGSDLKTDEAITAIIRLNKNDAFCPGNIAVNPDQFTALVLDAVYSLREGQ